ncbi:hypothetical protein CRUP_018279 [Coryphaenoides rupestris]|nr:hypothetical protein CRUP_018279 [Coryphaenoides rupestris]
MLMQRGFNAPPHSSKSASLCKKLSTLAKEQEPERTRAISCTHSVAWPSASINGGCLGRF